MRYMRQFHWAGSWLVERVVEIGIGILEDVTRMEGESISKGRSRGENLKLLAPFSTNNFPRIRLDRGLRIEGSVFLRLGTEEKRRSDKRNPRLGQLVDLCLHNGGTLANTRALSAWIEMIVSRHVFIRHARP